MTRSIHPTAFVHPTAVVDEGAVIGEGARIWHFCHVMSGAVVGAGTSLGQNCFVASGAIVMDRVKVQNNVSLYDGVTIEDDVFLGPSAVLTNVTNPRSEVSRRDRYERTLVRRGATIGANATLVPGVTLGAHAFVAAGAVVTRSFGDHAFVVGVPARQEGWMSRVGCRFRDPRGQRFVCPETGEVYVVGDDGELRLEDGVSRPDATERS